jgi:hypothetical protein
MFRGLRKYVRGRGSEQGLALVKALRSHAAFFSPPSITTIVSEHAESTSRLFFEKVLPWTIFAAPAVVGVSAAGFWAYQEREANESDHHKWESVFAPSPGPTIQGIEASTIATPEVYSSMPLRNSSTDNFSADLAPRAPRRRQAHLRGGVFRLRRGHCQQGRREGGEEGWLWRGLIAFHPLFLGMHLQHDNL